MSKTSSIFCSPVIAHFRLLIIIVLLPTALDAIDPSFTLIQYATLDPSPFIISHTDDVILAAYHNTSGILLREYCSKVLTNEYIVSISTLIKLVQENSDGCGEGNIILYESTSMMHVFNKVNGSILNSYSLYSQIMFAGNSSMLIYQLYPSILSQPEFGALNLQISQDSNLTSAISFGVMVSLDLIYSKNSIFIEAIALLQPRKIFRFDSNLQILTQFTLAIPPLLLTAGKFYVQYNYLTHIYSKNIDIYDFAGNLPYAIVRPNNILSACYFGNQVWSIEALNGKTILFVIDPSTQAQLASFIVSETGVNYEISYLAISDEVILYTNASNILLTIGLQQSASTQTPTDTSQDIVLNPQTSENLTKSIQSEFVANFSARFFQEETHEIIASAQIGVSISVASSVLPGVSRPIFSLIEDFWFYKFHPRRYPEFVQNLTEEFSLLNEIRIKPDFIDAILMENEQYFIEQVSMYSEATILKGRAPQNQYLLSATHEVYMYNFALVAFISLLLYLFKAIIYILSKFCLPFEKLYPSVDSTIKFRNIYLSLVLPNLSVITFFCVIQFRTFFSFDFFNKLNMLVTVSAFYIWLTTATISYLLIYKYEENNSEDLLDSSKYSLQGFVNEAILNNVRRLLQAIIHGLLLDSQNALIGMLCLVDLFVLVSCFKFRKSFKSKIIQGLAILYFFAFFIFDLSLLFYIIECFPTLDYDLMILIIVLALFVLTILKTLVFLIIFIKDSINFLRREFCFNNMVQDLPPQKNQAKEEPKKEEKQAQVAISKQQRNKKIDRELNGISVEDMEEGLPEKLYINVYEHEKKIRLVFTEKKKNNVPKDKKKVTFLQ